MIIPKKFKVAGRDYLVKLISAKEMNKLAGDDMTLGYCLYDPPRLYLNKDFHKTREWLEQTFLHELIHALKSARGEREHDEIEIDGLASLLHQYFKTAQGDIGHYEET